MKIKRIISYLLVLIFSLTITNVSDASTSTGYYKMLVHYIDVGESDSVLIESDGKFMLIDAGDTDDGDDVVAYLKTLKVKKLDYVICTHPHADHIGGMDEVIEAFNIGKLVMPSKTHTTKTFENLLDAIDDKGLKITKPVVGTKYTLGKASFTILAPNSSDYGDSLNDYSVAIRLINGKTSFLFIGDCETEAIEDILDNGISIDSTVLMTGHHGSHTSTSQDLLDVVTPKYAVISVGENSYGHPHDETLELLSENDVTTYRTDENSTITATSTGKAVSFDADASDLSKNEDNNGGQQDMVVYVTKTGSKYHLATCSSLKLSKIKTTIKNAKDDGYEPCGLCHPPE